MNDLPLFELHLHQLAGDTGVHGDGVDGSHRAETCYENLNIAFRRSRRHHLRRPSPRTPPAPSTLRRALPRCVVAAGKKGLELGPLPIADPSQHQQNKPPDPASTGRRLRWIAAGIAWPVGVSL